MAGCIDLNCDLGEGYGSWTASEDEALLRVVTSANVACGFHAGDPSIMRAVVRSALGRAVALGAHVSYPDLRGFGRTEMAIAAPRVVDDILYQLGALDGIARAMGGRVRYVKAHGALYHRLADDQHLAASVAEMLAGYEPSLVLLLPPGAPGTIAASASGIRVVTEGFADRRYCPSGRLVPRREPDALLEDPLAAAAQGLRLASEGVMVAQEPASARMEVGSLCVHGDSPGAPARARAVRDALVGAGIEVRPFCPSP